MDQNVFNMNGVMPQGQMPQGQIPGQIPGQMPMNNHMQRAQPGINNDQIFAKILETMQQKSASLTGWQATLDVRERAAKATEMCVPRSGSNQVVQKLIFFFSVSLLSVNSTPTSWNV